MLRLKHQRHPPAFQLGVPLDFAERLKLGFDLLEDLPPQIHVGHFAAAELEGELHLVVFLEKIAGVIDLDLKIMIANLHRAQLQFLELTRSR